MIKIPYTNVADARKKVKALKNLSDSQVKTFISVFNRLVKDGEKEDSAYAQAIATAKKTKNKSKEDKNAVYDMIVNKYVEEKMIAYEPMYCPPNVADCVQDAMTEEEITKMVDNANKKIGDGTLKPYLFHKTPTEAFSFVKAFVNPWNCTVGDHKIYEGQPVIVVKYHNKSAWELRKAGVIKGPSIGGVAGSIEMVGDLGESIDE